jgi:flagellar biosynthetic protein FlhB
MSGGGEKTEAPTQKKLKEGRQEGRIARSTDLSAWTTLLAASVVVPVVVRKLTAVLTDLLLRIPEVIADPDPAVAMKLLSGAAKGASSAWLLLAATTVGMAIASTAVQGGLHPATKLLKPKFSRLNPLPGLKRLAGPHSAWEAAKGTIKTAVVAVLLWSSVRSLLPVLIASGALPLSSVVESAVAAITSLIRVACAAGLAIAAADYIVARRRTGKQLKMSKQDIKEENRQAEGDPQLRGAIRSRQLSMSRNRMIADVATADVVLVNPTQVAVALRYEPERGAPRVVAKGAGAIAAKIRQRAEENRVPMVRDVPLARALHKACELGQEVPPELYAAVATVLAFVMSLKVRGSAAGVHTVPGARPVAA